MSAFETYARYYDLLYRDKDYAAEARLVDEWLRQAAPPARTLLDVGCGTGAHAREFAKLGWRVAGVDLSSAMIAIARERSRAVAGVEFVTGAATEFSLERTFAAAVSLFHVTSYQAGKEEAFRMFANVRRHLAPESIFIFDFWHASGVLGEPPTVRTLQRADDKLRIVRTATPTLLPAENTVLVDYEIVSTDVATNQTERIHERHRLRYFSAPELTNLLHTAGFSVLRTQAGLTPAALHPAAWYGLIVARAV